MKVMKNLLMFEARTDKVKETITPTFQTTFSQELNTISSQELNTIVRLSFDRNEGNGVIENAIQIGLSKVTFNETVPAIIHWECLTYKKSKPIAVCDSVMTVYCN